MASEDCVFCRIVREGLPARVVYSDAEVLAFLDLGQATPGHTLVIPRAHRRDLWDVTEDELRAVAVAGRRVARALREELDAPGMLLHQVSGAVAGQDVFHFHLHLIPRYEDDTVQPSWGRPPWEPPRLLDEDLDGIAARVRARLA